MSLARLTCALLFGCVIVAAAVPAAGEDQRDTIAALRKAKTKEERLAALKGKGDRRLEGLVEYLLD